MPVYISKKCTNFQADFYRCVDRVSNQLTERSTENDELLKELYSIMSLM